MKISYELKDRILTAVRCTEFTRGIEIGRYNVEVIDLNTNKKNHSRCRYAFKQFNEGLPRCCSK